MDTGRREQITCLSANSHQTRKFTPGSNSEDWTSLSEIMHLKPDSKMNEIRGYFMWEKDETYLYEEGYMKMSTSVRGRLC